MKIIRHLTRPQDADSVWQKRITTAHPGRFGAHDGRFEMHDLRKRMHACVSSPSGMHTNWFSSNPCQGMFQRILYATA